MKIRLPMAMLLVAWCAIATPLRAADAGQRSGRNPPEQMVTPDKPCDELDEPTRRKTERCKTEEERRIDDQAERDKARMAKEDSSHTSFLRWLHTDGLWIQPSSNATMHGLVGAHLAVANVGRIHLYGPPGVMLVLENTSRGRVLRARYTWGVSIHLTEFRMPGTTRNAQLFVSIAKVWSGVDYRAGADMMGLSITWKK